MSISKFYLGFISFVLIGYAFFDKGFAYVGYAPVYIGEIAFAAGLLVLLLGGLSSAVLRSPIAWATLAFVFWGALNTLPYYGEYGILVLRDGIVWGYAAFALFVAGVLLRTGLIERTVIWYHRWVPWFVIWAPIILVSSQIFLEPLPGWPGFIKHGDVAVHLAGAGAFVALGLHLRFDRRPDAWLWLKEWVWWSIWLVGLMAAGSKSRGGLLSVLVALAVVMVLRPANRMRMMLFAGIIIFTLGVALNVSIPFSRGRVVSPQQILSNVESIFVPSQQSALQGTVQWRFRWWETILDYTVFGEHFWTGKGYGVNLSESDGFRATGKLAARARHPHSIHFTILARSGVPGLVLWVIVLGTVFFSLFRGVLRARGAGWPVLGDVNIWLMAYLMAFIVNASFDVYIEGPQGGIWFWCLVGFAIALTEARNPVVPALAPMRLAPALAAGEPPPGGQNDGQTAGLP